MRHGAIVVSLGLVLFHLPAMAGQEYTVRAVEADSGKLLKGMPITLRYDCVYTGSGLKLKVNCRFIQRKTGADGLAHFPEAGSLHAIDDIFSLPIAYGAVCCDLTNPVVPGTGTIKFKRRTFGEMVQWIVAGP